MSDKQFMTVFFGVLAALFVIFFAIYFIAQIVTPDKLSTDSNTRNNIVKRIEPVGKISYEEKSLKVSVASTAKKTEFQYTSGKEVYEAVCQSCHNAGVINAPIIGDKASWGERANKKISLLYQNAINGLNAMPAKGGRPDLSDKEIEIAVDYMMDSIKEFFF